MNMQKEISKKFKQCLVCNECCFSLKAHMRKHIGKEITQKEYEEMFKKDDIKQTKR